MTMKAHTYYIIFGRPPIGGEASPSYPHPLAAPLAVGIVASVPCIDNPDTHAFSGMEMVPSI